MNPRLAVDHGCSVLVGSGGILGVPCVILVFLIDHNGVRLKLNTNHIYVAGFVRPISYAAWQPYQLQPQKKYTAGTQRGSS